MKKKPLKNVFTAFCVIAIALLGLAAAATADEIQATIDVDPDSVELASKGKWMTVYIELTTSDVSLIDINTVVLSINGNELSAETKPFNIGDYDEDTIPDLMVKFDRQQLQSHLFLGPAELTVSGAVNGDVFGGTDTIKVMTNLKKLKAVTILQTSDIHHHAAGYGPYRDYSPDGANNDNILGGYARLATLIDDIRTTQTGLGIPTLVLDSGDFTMGTPYDFIDLTGTHPTLSYPLSLNFFQTVGYDAITLGNHEFDWSGDGTYGILALGLAKGFSVPVLASNMDSSLHPGLESLKNAGDIRESLIINVLPGIDVGLLGLMGPDAERDAPAADPVKFNIEDPPGSGSYEWDYTAIQAQVDALKSGGAEVVVILSHGGVDPNGIGDDERLAKNVTGIDIIASGHAHTETHDAFIVGNTIIFSPGEYSEWLSHLDFLFSPKLGRIVGFDFMLEIVDDSIGDDFGFQATVASYETWIDTLFLSPFGYSLSGRITETDFTLGKQGYLGSCSESNLGDLSADALRIASSNYVADPFDVAFIPNGVIRDDLEPAVSAGNEGVVTFSDVYKVLPLGFTPDPLNQNMPGYPLMDIYVDGANLYTILEVGITGACAPGGLGSNYWLNFSGVRIDYSHTEAEGFLGVQNVYPCPGEPFDQTLLGAIGRISLDDTSILYSPAAPLYHVVVDIYSLQLLYVVNDYLANLGGPGVPHPMHPPLIPRDAGGTPIADIMLHRVDSDAAAGVQEFKEWMALLGFLEYMDGIFPGEGKIPAALYNGGAAIGRINPLP